MLDGKITSYLTLLEEKVESVKTSLGNIKLDTTPITNKIDQLAGSFNTWKADWTSGRAAKIDNLDATVSSVKSAVQNIDLSSVAKENTLGNVKAVLDKINGEVI